MKIDGVKSVSATTGRKPAGWSSVTGGNYAQLNATMQDNRIKDTNNAIKQIRKLGYLVPGAEFNVAGDNGNGPAIYYSLTGPDDAIGPAAEKVAQFLRGIPGAVNVQTSAENGAPRMNVDVDRAKCELLGINPSDVATVARIAVDGAVATKVRTPTGLVDVRVQFPLADRTTEDALKNVKVRDERRFAGTDRRRRRLYLDDRAHEDRAPQSPARGQRLRRRASGILARTESSARCRRSCRCRASCRKASA